MRQDQTTQTVVFPSQEPYTQVFPGRLSSGKTSLHKPPRAFANPSRPPNFNASDCFSLAHNARQPPERNSRSDGCKERPHLLLCVLAPRRSHDRHNNLVIPSRPRHVYRRRRSSRPCLPSGTEKKKKATGAKCACVRRRNTACVPWSRAEASLRPLDKKTVPTQAPG